MVFGSFSTFCRHFLVLSYKNVILRVRNWKGTLGQLLSPVVIVLCLFAFQKVSDYILSREIEHPDSVIIGDFPRCVPHSLPNCTTILWAPNNYPWVQQIMREIAHKTGLDYEKDFTSFGSGKPSIAGFRSDNSSLFDYMVKHQNATQNALFFYNAYFIPDPKEGTLPDDVGYALFYNGTTTDNPYVLELKKVLDEVIIEQKVKYGTAKMSPLSQPENVDISPSWKKFPTPKPRIAGYDVVAANGGVWFYLPPMITFFIILSELVTEKELRLRLGMRMMGLKTSAYWIVWALEGIFFVTLSTLILIVSGLICGFDFFTNSSFFAVFLLFFLFGISMVFVAFFCSTLVSASNTAQTVGYAVILIGFVFQTILASGYGILVDLLYSPDVKQWVSIVKIILQFYPPFNMSKAFYDISVLSSKTIDFTEGRITQGPGFHWSDLFKETKRDPFFGIKIVVPATIWSFVWMIVDAVFFAILTWYLDQVLPGEHGAPKPFYFFLTREYWGFHSRKKELKEEKQPSTEGEDSDVEEEAKKAKSSGWNNNTSKVAVNIVNLQKIFKSSFFANLLPCTKASEDSTVRAVDGVCLTVEEGEIFCLLGHNGAGKTTTINILTGLFKPSAGQATVAGKDVEEEMDEIRKIIGVCPQHDILWKELTAREHLRIFAWLKGMPWGRVESIIDSKLTEIGLLDVGNKRVGSFSGGMKRRLSVGISSIGEPSIIFMDEPTTGMDPVNRRAVWHMIQSMKVSRAIVLTTHSMEEADVLGDRIGIMAFGKLRCIGNALHLKTKYGSGYRINIMTDPPDVNNVVDSITRVAPTVNLVENDGGSLTFNIMKNDQEGLINVLKLLENEKIPSTLDNPSPKGAVKEWGVSHTTLEDVFLKITKKHNFKYDKQEEEVEDENEEDHNAALPERHGRQENEISLQSLNRSNKKVNPNSYPYRALFRKNFTLQARQKGTNCCQIITPVLVMGLLVLLQLIIQSELGDKTNTKTLTPALPHILNSNYQFQFDNLASKILEEQHNDAIMKKKANHTCLLFFLFADNTPNRNAGQLTNTTKSGLLGKMSQSSCVLYNGTTINVPYFLERNGSLAMDNELFDDLNKYNSYSLEQLQGPPYWDLLPDGTAEFFSVDISKGELNYTMSVDDNLFLYYHRPNNFTRMDLDFGNSSLVQQFEAKLLIPLWGQLQLMDMINYAFYHLLYNITELHVPFMNLRLVVEMPYLANADLLVIVEAFGTFLYPIALTLQLPIYIYLLVLEKEEKLREMMKSMGMKTSSYIISTYIFSFTLYAAVISFFWLAGFAAKIRFFSQTGPSLLVIFFIGWGTALIAMAFLISSFINSKRAATVIGYVIALMGTLIALVICVGIYGNFAFSVADHLPTGLLVYPQFAFTRGIYLMNLACAEKFICYGEITSLHWEDELTRVIIALYLSGIIYLTLGLYLDAVLPKEFGVPKHPLFFINWIWERKKGQQIDVERETDPLLIDEEKNAGLSVDSDCLRERDVVKNSYLNDAPLVINRLCKRFGDKVAVQDLYLIIQNGECFGLLGENGAGKTTTISMLTGVFPPTSGYALVGGFDIRNEIDKVHLVMGVCPQFNILWEDLTVMEHMLFYSRLKGISPKNEKEHVLQALHQVGLRHVPHRKAKDLSGGMKRRLSVAIALVGQSVIVFLDEPTTGLDPASRRQLWKILQRAKRNRALVLTTHAMDEAELLCNRVGIMAKGKMRCLGTSTHLQQNFGDGYRLQINFHPSNEHRAVNYIRSIFPGATEHSTFKGTANYYIPKQGVSLSDAFALMENNGHANAITAFSISQIGLDDVFQKIIATVNASEPATSTDD